MLFRSPEPSPDPAPEPPKEPAKEPSAEDDPLGLSKFKKKPEEPKKAEPAKPEPSKKPEAQQTPKELRTAYEKLKGELDAERQAKAALQTKLDEALKRPVPEELEKKWKGDIEAASKRASELEESLKLTNFEKSPTYTKEFIEPLTNDCLPNLWHVVFSPFRANTSMHGISDYITRSIA